MNSSSVDLPKRRFAVFGFIDEHAGSQASASYKIVERMLELGHEIHLYGMDGFITPGNLSKYPNLSYIPVSVAACRPVWKFLEKQKLQRVKSVSKFLFAKISNFLHLRVIGKKISCQHSAVPYDVLFSFGTLSPYRLKNAKTISWPQGPPSGEFEWILRNRRKLIRKLGVAYVLLLIVLYFSKCRYAKFAQKRSDLIFGGSKWTLSMWRKLGVPDERLVSLAYPVDLVAFAAVSACDEKAANKAFTFLHLGRIVPRKRLDLLLDAFEIVRKAEPISRLLIIGSFSYATVYKTLLDQYKNDDQFEYREKVARSEVPELLSRVECSIQTSENEDFGSTIAESLACGTPVILGPSNGTSDYVPESCARFGDYSAQEVAQAMLTTIRAMRGDGQSIRESCRKAAVASFNVENITSQILHLAVPPRNHAIAS